MIIGTVRGDIVSTINHPFYTGKRLLVVEKELARRLDNVKLDAADTPEGPELVIEWAAQAA